MAGFNRRFSAAAIEVKQFLNQIDGPVTVSYRFNAGPIDSDHWTQNEKIGGGRIIGEACHAIDLATFLTGSKPVKVFTESIGGANAPEITDDQCFITMRHANGSISSVAYLAGGDKAVPKERVEIIGGGRVAIINDFQEVTLTADGKTQKLKGFHQDKGHLDEVEAFTQSLVQGNPSPISWDDLRAVSLTSILAVRSIREGVSIEIP